MVVVKIFHSVIMNVPKKCHALIVEMHARLMSTKQHARMIGANVRTIEKQMSSVLGICETMRITLVSNVPKRVAVVKTLHSVGMVLNVQLKSQNLTLETCASQRSIKNHADMMREWYG